MGLIKYITGSDGRKSLKKLNEMADRVEALEPKYQVMDDETLKSQTQVLKDRLAAGETLDDILYDAFAALREAAAAGVHVKAYDCSVAADSVSIRKEIPVRL